MRAFIILGFLAAAVSASTIELGHGLINSNYGLGAGLGSLGGTGLIGSGASLIGTGGSSLLGTGGSLIGTGGSLLGAGGYGGGYQSYGSGLINAGSGLISSGSGLLNAGSGLISSSGLINSGSGLINNLGGGATVLGLDALNTVPTRVELNKQFFDFSAPEEEQDAGVINQQVSNVLKKNLQVVFIKAPENNAATNAALQVAKQAIEQKTAIYVLSKENDAAQVIGTLQQIQENVPTTPEVRIVKYKTQGDLINARNIIQSQYENIGGSSQVINGGLAPVLNYASRSVVSGPLLGGSLSGIGSGIVSNLGSGIGSGIVSNLGSGIGSGIVSNIGSGLDSGIGVNYISGSKSIIGGSPGGYLPPSPLKK